MDIITIQKTSTIFKKVKNTPININEVDTEKNSTMVKKTPYGEEGANKYYIGYVVYTRFRPLCIIFKDIKLYTDHMNVLANNNELSKYIKIWNKIETILNKKGFHNRPVYNEYIKTKISSYNENFHVNKRLIKDKYYGHSILLLESICEVENKYDPQIFLEKFFKIHNNKNSLFKELVQIADWSDDDESNDKS